MKKNLLFIAAFVFGGFSLLQAQWDSIARFNQAIYDMKTYNSNLFVVGNFTKINGNTCYWSTYYDGSSWAPHTNLIGGSGINGIDVFGSDLYAVDDLNHGGVSGVGLWTGSTWTDGGSTNVNYTAIYADGNDLYTYGTDHKINKKTGAGNFSVFYDFGTTGGAGSFVRYNGKLICSGSFTVIGGVPANRIAAWDGTNWTALGTGLSAGASCMTVYNNELYVAGKITTAGGVTVNNIAKWNGTTWSSVGGGTGASSNGVRDLKTIATGVIAVGDFTQVGGVNTSNVAYWNGSVWAGLGLTHGDSFANRVEVFNNKIYVGTFDFNHAHVYRYNGAVGVAELTLTENNVSVYPNPAKDMITVEIPSDIKTTASIKNLLGQDLMVQEMTSTTAQLNISSLPTGVYVTS